MFIRGIAKSIVIRILAVAFIGTIVLFITSKVGTIDIEENIFIKQNTYLLGYRNVTLSNECNSKPEFPERAENIAKVNSYRFSVPEKYKKYLMLNKEGIELLATQDQNSSIPVLASAISSNHFTEFCSNMQYNKENLLMTFPSMKVVIFDLGLKQTEKDYIGQHYKHFMIRKYPFEKFPNHVRYLKNYCWKPLAIQMMLQEFDFVYWTDASVKTFAKTAELLFQRTIRNGIQCATDELSRTFPQKDFPKTITGRTSPVMFKFLNEDPCLYRFPEVLGGWNVFKRSGFVLRNIMLPWVSCALQFGCMDFQNSGKLLHCPAGKEFKVGSCHRYDQSVLGILLTRLFNKNRDDVTFVGGHFGILNKL